MFNLKKNLFNKINRRNLLRTGIMLPGIALLSLNSGIGCSSDADADDDSGSDEFFEVGGLTVRMASRDFSDSGSMELEADTCGWGWIQIGGDEAYAHFTWDGDNAVTEITSSGPFATSDTPDNLCIFDNGTNVEIKNNLNAALTMRYVLYYSPQGLTGGVVAPAAPTSTTTSSSSTSPSAPTAT